MIAGCGYCLGLDAQRALGFVRELAKELQDGVGASVISSQYAAFDLMLVRIRREDGLQRLDITFCEGLVAAPHDGDVSGFDRARPALVRPLP